MAELNLLQGKFTGRLGELSGSTWKGKAVVKAAPFSKAPPTSLQTANVRAFECLNRLASAIAKAGWVYLGLSGKGVHPHNAVARWLKPVVKDHRFEPANIAEVIPPGQDIRLTGWTLNRSTGIVNIRLDLKPGVSPPEGSKLFIAVFDDTGKTYFAKCRNLENVTARIHLETFGNPVYSILAFTTEPTKKGYSARNFLYKRGQGMKYSEEEQPTGDIWLDGRPIYQKTYTFNTGVIPSNLSITVNFPEPDISELIQYHAILRSRSGQQIQRASPIGYWVSATYPSSHTFIFCNYRTIDKQVSVIITNPNETAAASTSNSQCVCTIRYTKSSDQPVVDG